jgi:hypothetical protein
MGVLALQQVSVTHLSTHIYVLLTKCSGYLQQLGRQRLTADIQRMLTADTGLKTAAAQYYLPNISGGSGSGAADVTYVREHDDGNTSDFSDFSDM